MKIVRVIAADVATRYRFDICECDALVGAEAGKTQAIRPQLQALRDSQAYKGDECLTKQFSCTGGLVHEYNIS